jgi:hypothetical protein
VAAVVFGLEGCGGGSVETLPPNPEYKVPVMPDAMKGANMKPRVIPKAGTPGKGGETAPEAK